MANLTHARAVNPGPGIGRYGGVLCQYVDLAVAAADLTLNAVHKVWKAPAGAVVLGAGMLATDLDTNGSPAVALKLGDLADDDRLIAASNIGQAGGATQTLAATGMLYKFTAETDVYVKVSTAAATAAAGTISVAITYVLDPATAA